MTMALRTIRKNYIRICKLTYPRKLMTFVHFRLCMITIGHCHNQPFLEQIKYKWCKNWETLEGVMGAHFKVSVLRLKKLEVE